MSQVEMATSLSKIDPCLAHKRVSPVEIFVGKAGVKFTEGCCHFNLTDPLVSHPRVKFREGCCQNFNPAWPTKG